MPEKGRGLEERTALFAARIVNVCEAIPPGRLKSGHLKDRLFRAGTSVAAKLVLTTDRWPFAHLHICTLREMTREDFVHKMKLAMKELAEARCWLRIIGESGYLPPERLAPLIEESRELSRMMGASVATARSRMERGME